MVVPHQTYQQRGYCRRGGHKLLSEAPALCGEIYSASP